MSPSGHATASGAAAGASAMAGNASNGSTAEAQRKLSGSTAATATLEVLSPSRIRRIDPENDVAFSKDQASGTKPCPPRSRAWAQSLSRPRMEVQRDAGVEGAQRSERLTNPVAGWHSSYEMPRRQYTSLHSGDLPTVGDVGTSCPSSRVSSLPGGQRETEEAAFESVESEDASQDECDDEEWSFHRALRAYSADSGKAFLALSKENASVGNFFMDGGLAAVQDLHDIATPWMQGSTVLEHGGDPGMPFRDSSPHVPTSSPSLRLTSWTPNSMLDMDPSSPSLPSTAPPRESLFTPPSCSEAELGRLFTDIKDSLAAAARGELGMAGSAGVASSSIRLGVHLRSVGVSLWGAGHHPAAARHASGPASGRPVMEENEASQLVESIRQATEALVWGERHDSALFDLFCEYHMLAAFVTALHAAATPRAVKVQLLQSLAILVQNARRSTSTFYLLSGGLLNALFDAPPDLEDEEVMAYFVALLKGLALRLDAESAQLCLAAGPRLCAEEPVDRQWRRLPILERASVLLGHKELMVRTAARTASLSILRIDDPHVRLGAEHCFRRLMAPSLGGMLRSTWAMQVDAVRFRDKAMLREAMEREDDLIGFANDIFALDILSLSHALAEQLLVALMPLLRSLAPEPDWDLGVRPEGGTFPLFPEFAVQHTPVSNGVAGHVAATACGSGSNGGFTFEPPPLHASPSLLVAFRAAAVCTRDLGAHGAMTQPLAALVFIPFVPGSLGEALYELSTDAAAMAGALRLLFRDTRARTPSAADAGHGCGVGDATVSVPNPFRLGFLSILRGKASAESANAASTLVGVAAWLVAEILACQSVPPELKAQLGLVPPADVGTLLAPDGAAAPGAAILRANGVDVCRNGANGPVRHCPAMHACLLFHLLPGIRATAQLPAELHGAIVRAVVELLSPVEAQAARMPVWRWVASSLREACQLYRDALERVAREGSPVAASSAVALSLLEWRLHGAQARHQQHELREAFGDPEALLRHWAPANAEAGGDSGDLEDGLVMRGGCGEDVPAHAVAYALRSVLSLRRLSTDILALGAGKLRSANIAPVDACPLDVLAGDQGAMAPQRQLEQLRLFAMSAVRDSSSALLRTAPAMPTTGVMVQPDGGVS